MSEPAGPHLTIERGTPDDTELAAVLLVLLSATRGRDHEAPAPPPPRATWGPARGWRPPGTWPAL
ncbi:acyl-CoA carboxylase subunit epsilon [Streptomyces sp. NBC_00876]|uniref:acyl-CoA carboxylase epsilon subunit n=1 Tax=Streptomyces sp. NBC_00876 TaxID=2975853 RepID=UPI00386AA813|nr:acyl-CoA carboxylase subunit epsilon [Streptomyces sp. NBC_00876]